MAEEKRRAAFGEYLRGLRNAAGKSLRDVQREAGISPGYLSLVESGDRNPPKPAYLNRLAECYGVSALELFRRAGHLEAESEDSSDAELRHAYEFVLKHPRFDFGHRVSGPVSPEVMRFVVELFDQAMGTKLLGDRTNVTGGNDASTLGNCP